MRCDMVVAVGSATVDGHTLFGHTCAVPFPRRVGLLRTRGRDYALGESVYLPQLELPQVRHTATVVAAQPEGCWGYVHGLNEHGLVVGLAPLAAQLASAQPGLLGTDLVRLALERCRSAQQALDLLTDLLPLHGRAGGALPFLAEHDPAFLLADSREAFALESAGGYWAEQEVGAARAISEVRVIRQDWDRIAPGFAELAIEHGWWPADGTKLDFAGCLGESPASRSSGWSRWGRATLLLEEQNGHLDALCLRRLLGDLHEETPAEANSRHANSQPVQGPHALGRGGEGTVTSLVARTADSTEHLPLAWWAFGPPRDSIWFPILLEGELPAELTECGPKSVAGQLSRLHGLAREARKEQALRDEELSCLQARLDQDAEEFAAEGATLKARGEHAALGRLATAFLQHTVERFEAAMSSLMHDRAPVSVGTW